MSIFKFASAAIAVCFLNLLIKEYKPEYALFLPLTAGTLIIAAVLPQLALIFSQVSEFTVRVGLEEKYISAVIKIIGTAFVTQYIAELCRDAGERAMALKLEMAGKIIILAFAVPIAAAFFRALESVLP